ncbi:MAG TPA: hypothetical protein VMZ92_03940 [Planctomycetota bacterium]|nr:hypothetical protein [Planctomycetota bacterium]
MAGTGSDAEPDDVEEHPLLLSLPPWRVWGVEFRRALLYPLRPRGITFILLGAFIWSAGECGGYFLARLFTLPLISFYLFFIFTYLLNIVRESGSGSSNLPPVLWGRDLPDDVVRPLGYLLFSLLVCYLPVMICVWRDTGLAAALVFAVHPAHDGLEPWQVVMKMAGSFYFPMAVLAVTANRDLRAISPHFVVPAILKVPLQYTIVAGTFMWVGGIHDNLLHHIFDMRVEASLALLIVKAGLLYVYFVLARMLGMTHWVYRKRLGWFKRL